MLVLVGPNNAGKSAALREIARHIAGPNPQQPPPPVVVIDETIATEGSAEELEEWLKSHAFTIDRPDGRWFQWPRANVRWDILRSEWGSGQRCDQPSRVSWFFTPRLTVGLGSVL